MTVPTWVTTSVGIYALLGSIFMLVGIVVAGVTIRLLLDVRTELQGLSRRVEVLTNRVDTIGPTRDPRGGCARHRHFAVGG